jgi:hypothetical protein
METNVGKTETTILRKSYKKRKLDDWHFSSAIR